MNVSRKPHQRLFDKLNNVRIKNKIILSYFFLMFLPLLVVGLLVVGQMRSSALNTAVEQASTDMHRVIQRTSDSLEVSMDVSNRLAIDGDMAKIATRQFGSVYDVVEAYRSYHTFTNFLDFNRDVSRIKLYVENPTLLNDWEFIPTDQAHREAFWYQEAEQNAGMIGWYSFPDVTRPAESSLSLVRRINFDNHYTPAVLVVDVNTDRLNALVRDEQFDTMILDDRGVVVVSREPALIGKTLQEKELRNLVASGSTGMHDLSIGSAPSRVFVEKFRPARSFSSLSIVSVFSVSAILADVNQLTLVSTLVVAGCFVLAFVFLYFLYSALANRLLRVRRHIDMVGEGNFDVEIPVDGRDEIGYISRQFNRMVSNIRELMGEVRRADEQKNQLLLRQRDMQIKMLASQINPHFLFNALESIRMKAQMSGASEVARTVKSLGRLMRKNLETDGKMIPLRDELESVRYYLEIAKFRMEDQIHYNIDIDPDAESLLVPPLIIEPLVENAVVHGIERKQGGGSVTVSAQLEHGIVRILVKDDGIGIESIRLESIRANLCESDGHHVGLGNVHQRLQWHFGQDSGLRISSDERRGTEIRFAIPLNGDFSKEAEHV